jgi:UDP-glucuronate decarboxylase
MKTTRTTYDDIVKLDLAYILSSLDEEFKYLAGKKLLITGGAGFLGYYLVQVVMEWNQRKSESDRIALTVFDNYLRGVPQWLKGFEEQGALDLVEHDVRYPLPDPVPNFDYIIHAATIASPTYYRLHPIETMDANVNGLRYLLEYALARKQDGNPVDGMLFFSSSEIYGDPSPENIPTSESYSGIVSCTGPRACYDESKRYGETLCVNFYRQNDLPIKVARPFNNYGPGLKITDKRVLPDFARNILSGDDIVLLSDGTPTRTFCYIADAIVGYYKILIKGRSGEAYNIGIQGPEISMNDLAHRLVTTGQLLFDYKGKVIKEVSAEEAYLIDNPQRRCPLIAKASEELGFNPTITLEEGLRRLLIWYHDHRDGRELL